MKARRKSSGRKSPLTTARLPATTSDHSSLMRAEHGDIAMPSSQSRYHEVYARWAADPEGFWQEAAREIDWIKPADRIFDVGAGAYGAWFPGALCNTCHNAVDRHVETRGDQA